MQKTKANRNHKNRLFLRIFRDKEDLLSLYNAVNDSSYDDPELLEITTLEDVLYMGIKNDISFLIDSDMNLYEAQSTWNPNMPLRGLFYFSRLYSAYVESKELDIYSKAQLRLPTPRYIVFYNGLQAEPEIQTLRLSSSFENQEAIRQAPCLECIATVLNINYGHNKELMNNCRKLYEYSYLIHKIRGFLAGGFKLDAAVDLAIEDCLRHNILRDFLIRHREEAKFMILSEYNEELHKKTLYEEGKNDLRILLQNLMDSNRMEDMRKAIMDSEFCDQLLKEYNLHP